MSTLLLRLAAPIQSYGMTSKFNQRETQRLPTKSAVIGLLASALGRRRNEDIADLNALRMGVRADQEGELLRDFHIAKPEKKDPYVTDRYYLADAVFLVGLEGEEALLLSLDSALCTPAFPLFLGRRSCPPTGRLSLGVRKGVALKEALQQEPWQASAWYRKKHQPSPRLQTLMEVAPGTAGAFYLQDNPISFDPLLRQHGYRSLVAISVVPPDQATEEPGVRQDATLHDPFADWGD